MSYIPSIREDGDYSEKNLDKYGKAVIDGYDWAVEQIENFFDNLDMYEMELNVEGVDINIARFFDNHPEVRDAFVKCMGDWFEMQRNEIGVSLLENQAE